MKKMSRTTNLNVLVTAIAMTLTAASLSAADRMRAGQWEVATTERGKTTAFKQCVRAADAAAMNGDAKSSQAFFEKNIPASCKFTDYKLDGSSASFTLTCGNVTVHSVTHYHGDSYDSESKTTAGGAAETVTHIAAKRVGDCP